MQLHKEQKFTELSQQLDALTLRDYLILKKRLQHINKINNPQVQKSALTSLSLAIEAAKAHFRQRKLSIPLISYPKNLPVVEKKAIIAQTIKDNQVVIIAGETGSGKTTQIPKICLELGRGIKGFIGHTQPRRLAARSVATRLAQELESEVGKSVGYKVRFGDHISETTLVKLMTDGILLAEIQQDKLLMQYDTLIIDEAHERSLNIDFILGYLKQILPNRPDLKIIITSATIDPERFSKHFNSAPIIEVSGRTYPVDVRYRPLEDNENSDQLQGIFDAIDELTLESADDILIFLTGEKEIRDTADALTKRNLPHTEVLSLFARLSAAEQNRIFQSHVGRRIILATNVAETSLTVPGIKYVIDSGMARISRYSSRTKVQRLPIEAISQASANQRKGRCGRISDGICIRLYAEQDFLSRPLFTDPEIVRTNLASVILQMTALDLGDISAFPFVEMPDKRNIQDGIRVLDELGALNIASNNRYYLTDIGKQLAQLPLDPRLARMIIEAKNTASVHEIMIITSALSIQDPRERPLDKQQAADEKHRRFNDKLSDFSSYINLWNYIQEQQKQLTANQFRKQCRHDFLNYLRIREWQDVYTQLRQTIKELKLSINSQPAAYQAIHCALLSGLLSHIGMKDQEKHEYNGARNARFSLFPNSVLFKKPPKWCIVAELVETTKVWGRVAASIEPQWIEPLAQHLIKRVYSEPHWSKKQGTTLASEKVTLFGLPIVTERKVNYSQIDPTLSRELFIRCALVEGDWSTNHRFFHNNRKLLEEAEELEHKSRRRDIVVDDQQLFDFYDQRIGHDVISARHFDKWWNNTQKQQPDLLNFTHRMLVNENTEDVNAIDYPNFWYQHNLKLALSYQFEPGHDADGVTVYIPLSLLNQVEDEGFDWQIPGLRRDLIIALIKSLPKPIRRSFVPAPNYAEAFFSRVEPLSQPVLTSLENEFRKISGVTIEREDWRLDQVPDYLKMTFRVVNEHNKKISESKSLYELKQLLKHQVKQELSAAVNEEIERSNIHRWNFGTLPQCYEQKRKNYSIKAYPAIIDEKDSVSIKLVETEQEQTCSMRSGLRRLLLLDLPSPVKYLHEKLPNKAKLGLYFTPFGTVLELIDDCIMCAIDKLMTEHGGTVWQEAAFNELKEYIRQHLNDNAVDIAQQVEKILTLTYQLNKRIKGRIDISMALALSDIKNQIDHLIYKGFITDSGYSKLPDIYRYLQAIEKRLDKLPSDTQRDKVNMLKIEQVKDAYQSLLAKYPPHKLLTEEIKTVRWMIEELRVNYFAQQLGAPYSISEKRIMRYMESLSL